MMKTTPSFLAFREDWGLKVPAFEREGRTARLPITAVHFYFSHSSSVPKHYQDVKTCILLHRIGMKRLPLEPLALQVQNDKFLSICCSCFCNASQRLYRYPLFTLYPGSQI